MIHNLNDGYYYPPYQSKMMNFESFRANQCDSRMNKIIYKDQVDLDLDKLDVGYEYKEFDKLFKKNKNFFPCFDCMGKQGHRHCGHPNELRGHWIDCKKCKGTGFTTKAKFEKIYQKYVENWQKYEEIFKNNQKRLAEIREILTDEDFEILAQLHFKCCECGEGHD